MPGYVSLAESSAPTIDIMPHYLLIYLLLGILFGRIDALTKKQTYDIENITVFDYPDEDTCDYDIYLWEVLSADLHWEEDQIDYYKLFDVTPKTTPLSEVKESYRNTLAFWDSWYVNTSPAPVAKLSYTSGLLVY